MLTDRRTYARTDDGQKVITVAYPEHSSGVLKSIRLVTIEQTFQKRFC